jgi:hypothetical protein
MAQAFFLEIGFAISGKAAGLLARPNGLVIRFDPLDYRTIQTQKFPQGNSHPAMFGVQSVDART